MSFFTFVVLLAERNLEQEKLLELTIDEYSK